MNWRPNSPSNNLTVAPSHPCTQVTEYLSSYVPRVASLAVCGTGYLGLAAWLDARWKKAAPQVHSAPTSFNCQVLSRCTTLHTPYSPLPFLCYGHVETFAAALLRCHPDVDFRREVITLEDGGCICLDWLFSMGTKIYEVVPGMPLLLLSPGCMAGSQAAYVRQAVEVSVRYGFFPVVFNARGFGGTPVITPKLSGTSGTADLRAAINCIKKHYPEARIFAVGWSLGANLLVKYLGEEGPNSDICAAASLSNVYDLNQTVEHLSVGLNRLYDWHLGRMLRTMFNSHRQLFNGVLEPGLVVWAGRASGLESFDRAVTLPTLQMLSTEEYYQSISCREAVGKVAVPLLCLNALDDPVVPAGAIPYAALKANPNCIVVSTRCGGHLGWISGSSSPLTKSWCDEAVLEFLQSVSVELDNQSLRNKLDSQFVDATTFTDTVTGTGLDNDMIKAHDAIPDCTADGGSTPVVGLHLSENTHARLDPEMNKKGCQPSGNQPVRGGLKRSKSSFGRSATRQGLADLAKQYVEGDEAVVAVWPVLDVNPTNVDVRSCFEQNKEDKFFTDTAMQHHTRSGTSVHAWIADLVDHGAARHPVVSDGADGAVGAECFERESCPSTPNQSCSLPRAALDNCASDNEEAEEEEEEDNVVASPPATPTQAGMESCRWRANRRSVDEDPSRAITSQVDSLYAHSTGAAHAGRALPRHECCSSLLIPEVDPDAAPDHAAVETANLQYEIWPESATAHRLRVSASDTLCPTPKFPLVRPGASFAQFSRTLSQFSAATHANLASACSLTAMDPANPHTLDASERLSPPSKRTSLDADIPTMPSAADDDDVKHATRNVRSACHPHIVQPSTAAASEAASRVSNTNHVAAVPEQGAGSHVQADVLPDMSEFLDDWGLSEKQLLHPGCVQSSSSRSCEVHDNNLWRERQGSKVAADVGCERVDGECEIQPCPDEGSSNGSTGSQSPTGLAAFHLAQMESIMFGM